MQQHRGSIRLQREQALCAKSIMQRDSQPTQLTDKTSTLVNNTGPTGWPLDTFPTVPSINMIDDSYWTDLPDLTEHSPSDPQTADLFNTDLGDLSFSSLYNAPTTTHNFLSSHHLGGSLFQEGEDCLADMDIASVLANADDFGLRTAQDKQLQPGTPSGQMLHFNDLLLQSHPPRSHTPVSQDTGQQANAGHDPFPLVRFMLT